MFKRFVWKLLKKITIGRLSKWFDGKIGVEKPEPIKKPEKFIDTGPGSRFGRTPKP